MSWDQIESKWAEMTRRVRSHWPDGAMSPLEEPDLVRPEEMRPDRAEQDVPRDDGSVARIAGRVRVETPHGRAVQRTATVPAARWHQVPRQNLSAPSAG